MATATPLAVSSDRVFRRNTFLTTTFQSRIDLPYGGGACPEGLVSEGAGNNKVLRYTALTQVRCQGVSSPERMARNAAAEAAYRMVVAISG
jgi:hypothetical protein